jgi:hypothetical protein
MPPWISFLAERTSMLGRSSVPAFLRSSMAISAFTTSWASVSSWSELMLVRNLLLMSICLAWASLHARILVSGVGIPVFVTLA